MAARRNVSAPRKKRPRAHRRAPRTIPDPKRIIAATIELLARNGESGFRIEDLQALTAVNKSSLYLRYGDRDGLLAAAYGEIFSSHIEESIDGFTSIVRRATTPVELRAGVHAAIAFTLSPQRFERRLERVAIIAGIRGRPQYHKALSEAQTELTERTAALIDEAASRGLIKLRHPSHIAAQFIQGITLARILAEIEDPDDAELRDGWISLGVELIDQVMFGDLIDD